MDNSVYSCALVDGKFLGNDGPKNSQQQSLFARSAAELHKKKKNIAAQLNCQRTFIVDFDSSVADNNNTFVCPTSAYSKIIGAGCVRNDEQRNKSRFGDVPSLYGTIPLKGFFSDTSIIARHRLLSAQINAREFKIVRDAEAKSCCELVKLVCACPINPETHLGASPIHTFAITEKFCIEECNQTLSVESNRASHPFVLPKTKTGIKAVECIGSKALQLYFDNCNQDLICAALHLRFQTCEPHHFVPGLKFALLNSSNLVPADKPCETDCVSNYVLCPKLVTLLEGDTTVYEVYDVLTDYLFLAVPVTKKVATFDCDDCPADTAPWKNSVIASTMFRRNVYQNVHREHLSTPHCSSDDKTFFGRFEAGPCGVATAYIPCPTSPKQLACFVDQLAGSALHSGIDTNVEKVTYDELQDEFAVTFFTNDGVPLVRRTKNLLGSIDHYSTLSLSRNAMLATAKCPEAKQLYLNRALKGAFFFEIQQNVNDRFSLLLFIQQCAEVRQRTVQLRPGIYRPNELIDCLTSLLNTAVECEKELFEFQVDFTLHPTNGLLTWQQCGIGNNSKKQQQNFPVIGTSPYESQTFGFMIVNLKQNRFALDFTQCTGLATTLDFDNVQTEFANAHGSRAVSGIIDVMRCADVCTKLPSCPPCKTPQMRAFYTTVIDQCTGLVTIRQNGISPLYCNMLKANLVFCREAALCDDGPENSIDFPQQQCKTACPTSCPPTNCGQDELVQTNAVLFDNCCSECKSCDCKCRHCDKCGQKPCNCEKKKDCCKNCGKCKQCDKCCKKPCECGENDEEEFCDCADKCCDNASAFLVFQLPNDTCNPIVLPLVAGDVIWLRFGCRTIAACIASVCRDCEPSLCGTGTLYKIALKYNGRKLFNDLRGTCKDKELPSFLPVTIKLEPIGFNLHMNPAVTEKQIFDSTLPIVQFSGQSAISKWLGFRNAKTLSDRRSYTSDSCVQSLLDERLLLIVPELDGFGNKQPRYGVQSPSQADLQQHYGVLTLDRPSGVYRFDNASDSLTGFLELNRCTTDGCSTGCVAVSSSGNSQKKCLSFHLLRSDGSAYASCGDVLIASVEICYMN